MAHMLWLLTLVFNLQGTLSIKHFLTESDVLSSYLCDPECSLSPDTQLLLSTDVKHILSSTSFCLVSNTSNITIRSTSETPAIITCSHHNNSYVSVGFGFYNVSGLLIDNVHITQCGGPMPSTSTLYPNDTAFYFYKDQSVTLLISYSSDITILEVNINNYYGFAILLINTNKNTTLINVNISSSSGSEQCSINLLPSCGGSGLILYFSNLDNRSEVFDANVLFKKMSLLGNVNLVQYNDIMNAAKVHTEEPKAISAFAAGMTVIFSQGNYNATVFLSYTYWNLNIGGVFNGLALIFSDAPIDKANVTISQSRFHHRIIDGRRTFGIGCMVYTRMAPTFIESTFNIPWNILTIIESLVQDRYHQYRFDDDFSSHTPSNPYNHSIFHVITSSDISSKLKIYVSNFKYS